MSLLTATANLYLNSIELRSSHARLYLDHVPNKRRDGALTPLRGRQTVQSVELSTIAHATDDVGKVESALAQLLPNSLRGRQLFTRRYLQGHYGNPIVTFEAHLTDPEDVHEFKTYFLTLLAENDRSTIATQLDRHTDDDGNLYIRIDKQKILRGIIRLSQDDPIRVRMKFTKFTGNVSALIAEYLES